MYNAQNAEFLSSDLVLRKTLSLTGSNAAKFLSIYNVKKAFLATTGVSLESGVTNSSSEETCIKEMAVKKSLERYLLADSSKFGIASLLTYSDVRSLSGIITEKMPDQAFCEYAKEHQVSIITA